MESVHSRRSTREGLVSPAEVERIRTVYAERERTLPGTIKLDESNRGTRYLVREYRERLAGLLSTRLEKSLSKCRILDVGCGYGSLLAWLHEHGAPAENLVGVDLLPSRIIAARARYPDFIFIEGNAEQFAFPDAFFDLVSVFTVFSSILDLGMAKNVARSIERVLAPGGAIIWYDIRYPNPWSPHLQAMTRRRIRRLFPSFILELETITLLPPLARRLGRFTDDAYPLLASIPVLRAHNLGFLRPGGSVRANTHGGPVAGRCRSPFQH